MKPCSTPHIITCVCLCGVDASSATGGRAVWPWPDAALHVDEPALTDLPTYLLLSMHSVDKLTSSHRLFLQVFPLYYIAEAFQIVLCDYWNVMFFLI